MDVIVYDDDLYFIEFIKKAVNELNAKHSGVFNTPSFFNEMGKIMAYINANKEKESLYILDIMTGKEQTGYKIGGYIKEVNKDNIILYVTDYKDEILSNMKQKMLAAGFILKESSRFHTELEESFLMARDLFTGQYFVDNGSVEFIRLRYTNIYYFEKKKTTPYVHIVHKDGRSTIKDNLNNLKKRLDRNFCYATKEFIVNTQAITRVDKSEKVLYFTNGVQCPYSRTRKKELFKCLLEVT